MNITLPQLHLKQKEVLEYASQENAAQIITLVAGRRGGKSFVCAYAILYWAFLQSNLKIWYVTRSDRQVKEFFLEFINPILSDCPQIIKTSSQAKGVYFVEFSNGSRVEFKSSLAGNSLLGAGLDFCIVDEAAYVDEDVIQRIIMPMFATKRSSNIKGKVIIASSPRGTNSHLFKSYSQGLDLTQDKLRSVHFTVYDNPRRNDEWIELMKKQLTQDQFNQEILGQFTDAANLIQNINEVSILRPQVEIVKGQKIWVSCDIGLINDASTFFCLASHPKDINKLQVINFWRLLQPTVMEIKDLILEINKTYKPVKTVIESNNQGLPIIQSLIFEHRLNNVEPFTTTQVSKPIIINNLVYLFNQKQIEIIDDPQMKKELQNFCAVPQRNGRVKMMGMGTSDDLVMGLAIGAHIWSKEKTSGQYFVKVL